MHGTMNVHSFGGSVPKLNPYGVSMKFANWRHSARQSVLVVDDDECLRYLLASTLELESFDVQIAGGGKDAIETVRKKQEKNENFDIILLDIMMPDVDGWEVLKYVKSNAPSTKVIMLTAFYDTKSVVEAMRLGASDFLTKPLDIRDILASIVRVTAM